MKVAFINDSGERLGLQYISSLLKSAGHQTRLFIDPMLFNDEFITVGSLSRFFNFKNTIIRELKEYNPDIVGISVVTSFYGWACEMARQIKQNIDVPVILGGIHPTSVPEIVIKNKYVDMVCVGEGEYPMLELVKSMEKGRMDYSIKNIWFKDNGRVIANEIRPLIEDLDSLPLPDKDLYYSVSPHFSHCYYISASRGCPYSCSYCCNSYLRRLYDGKGKHLRLRSVQDVIGELEDARKKYRLGPVIFLDDCFGYNKDWLKDFSQEYRRRVGIGFRCMMHPAHISEDSIKYLKDAGCREIEIGVQSWDEKVREEVFKRKISNQVMRKAMSLIKEAQFNLVTGDLLGYPGQEEEQILKAVEEYNQLRPTRMYTMILKYYPKTAITEDAYRAGVFSEMDYQEIVDGTDSKFLAKKGILTDKRSLQVLILFMLIKLLPRKVVTRIINKKWYRYFPVIFTPAMVSILSNITNKTIESAINRMTFYSRYTTFLKKFLLAGLRNPGKGL